MILLYGTIDEAERISAKTRIARRKWRIRARRRLPPGIPDLPYVWPWAYPELKPCSVSPQLVHSKKNLSFVGHRFHVYTIIKCDGRLTMKDCIFLNGGKIEAEHATVTECIIKDQPTDHFWQTRQMLGGVLAGVEQPLTRQMIEQAWERVKSS